MTKALEARTARIIESYDGQGWHRTGTPVDAASAAWFVETLREMGAAPVVEEFTLERVEPVTAAIVVNGQRIEGLTLFDAPDIAGGSVRGAIGAAGSPAPIGLVVAHSPAPDADYDTLRSSSSHTALVTVTAGRAPGLQARNAVTFPEPFGVPGLQVSSEHLALLRGAAESGAEATLSIKNRRVTSWSSNIVVRVPGADEALAPLVVSTPRTGWWSCAGERGGGIACWFELLRSALDAPHRRDALFVTFAGHELDFFGLGALLERHPSLPTDAHAWVHFGANIGAVEGAAIRVSASNAEDLAVARGALEAESVGALGSPEAGTVIGGESHRVANLGARCVALVGGNDLFHLESDRWPANINVPQIARQATAFSAVARQLADAAG